MKKEIKTPIADSIMNKIIWGDSPTQNNSRKIINSKIESYNIYPNPSKAQKLEDITGVVVDDKSDVQDGPENMK